MLEIYNQSAGSKCSLTIHLREQMRAPVAVSQVWLGDSEYFRVRVGPLDDQHQLLAFQDRLRELGYTEARLMPD